MKDKILSFAGMGIKGRSSSDPLITHLSPTNHPLLQKAWKYTTCMLLVLFMGVGQMWGAEETVFSATCKVTSDVEISGSTSNQAVTAEQATFGGDGTFYVNSGESSAKKLLVASAGPSGDKKAVFTMTGSKTYFTITLASALQAGDVISAIVYPNADKTGENPGLWLTTASSRTGTVKAEKAYAANTWLDVSYTVVEEDGICGKTSFNIFRGSGTTTNFTNFAITRTTSGGGDDPVVDETAPTLASSVPANAATNVAVSGTIVLTFSEAIDELDDTKFTMDNATIGTVAIDGTDAKKVNVAYSGAANSTTVTLHVAAGAVEDAANNASAALDDIAFTTVAAEIVPDYLLINQSTGDVNTAQFRTTSTSNSKAYTVEGTDFAKYIQLGGAFATPVGVYETNKIIAYDAKTNSVTVQAWIYNKASSTDYKFYISMIEEGATTPTIKEFDAPKNKGTKAIWTFSPSKNATIYVHVGNNSNVHICQVGITESGAALLQGGAIGYTVNLESCRLAANKTKLAMDGIEYNATSNAVKVLTSGNPLKLKNTTEYIKFTLAEAEKVSIGASGTYSVTNSAAYDEDKAISNNQDVVLAAGTWYICPNGSNVSFSSLSFLAPPTAYKVTYAAGSFNETAATVKTGKELPKPADAIEGEKITLASGEDLQCAGADFAGWKANDTGDLLKVGDEYTMTNADVQFVAQWVEHVAKYTVKYMDGEEVLGSEEVTVGNHPAGIAAPEKDCYTFKAWSTALDEISGSDGETVNVNATWNPIYASSFNFGEATDLTKDNIKSKLNAVGIACGVGTHGGYDDGATTGYLGYKFKDKGDYIAFIVKSGYEAVVTYGFTQSGWTVNGVDAGVATATQAYVDVKYQAVGEDKLFKLVNQSADTKTSALSNIVIREIPAVSDDATLNDLTLKYGEADAETITGFASSTYIYNVVMPYGTTKAELPIVGATATHSGAQVTINQAVDREDWKTVVKVQAEDLLEEHDKYYEVRFAIEPKQGVSIIKATTQKVVTGYIGGTAVLTKNGEAQSGNTYKLDKNVIFGITLADDETFKAGDVFIMNITTAPGTAEAMGTMKVYDAADATEPIYETDEVGSAGVNYWTLPAAAEGKNSLYIKRGNGDDWNPTFSYVEVRRLMAPVIKSFKIGEAEGVISGTNIAVEVPNATDVTSLTPEIEYYGNGGGAIDKTGPQDFTNVVEYTVSSAYAEDATGAYAPVTYAVTVTKAAAIKEVVISGTLSVKENETTALSAVVYDTNDAEASNQAVVWSVKSGDESFAEVSAEGVVTGKAVGTAHIIATSVADDTKSAQVAVVISENPCRVWNAPTSSWTDASVTVGKLQIKRGDCPASSSMQPYQGAANNIYGIKVDGSNKFIELTMSDGSQFESMTLGAASNSNGSSPKYVVVASSAKVFAANAVLSAVEYVANAKDAAQALNEIELPLGTRNVRIYRSYDGKGDGTSVFLYFVEACKKELVALEGVTIVNANLAQGRSITPVLALNPTNADVASVTWSFENAEAATAAGLTINAATGEVSATADATEGGYTVKATVTDALSNKKSGTGTITVISAYQQANVTESIVWDWSASCWNGKANTEMTGDDRDADILMANAGPDIVNSNEFRSDMLIVNGQYAWRSEGTGKEYFQGTSIKFTTEVAGIVRVSYRGTGNSEEIHLTINGKDAGTHAGGFVWSNYIEVLANEEVVIVGTNTKGSGYTRIQKIEFVEIGYKRSGLNPANIGTICLPNGGIMKGATLYKMLGKDSNHKLNFEDVEGNRLEAGNPYIFVPEAGRTQVNVYYTDNENVSPAGEDHGLVGTFDILSTIDDGENSPLWGNYIISNNKYILVDSNNCRISANRAYIRNIYDDSKVPYINSNAAPAPGRKRLVIGAGAPQVATGIGDVQGDEVQSSKVLINGQLFILRGEKMYDATGRLVK